MMFHYSLIMFLLIYFLYSFYYKNARDILFYLHPLQSPQNPL